LKAAGIQKPDDAHLSRAVKELRGDLETLWLELANISGQPVDQLKQRAEAVVQQVRRWKIDYLQRRSIDIKKAGPGDL